MLALNLTDIFVYILGGGEDNLSRISSQVCFLFLCNVIKMCGIINADKFNRIVMVAS